MAPEKVNVCQNTAKDFGCFFHLPGFGKQSQVIQAQARPLQMSSSRFYRVHCHLSVVVGLRTACSAQETGVHLSEQATTGGRPGAAMYSVQCGRCVHCTLGQPCSECGSAHKVVDGASNQATCKASPPGFPLTPPPHRTGWLGRRQNGQQNAAARPLFALSRSPLSLPSGWAARFTLATTAQILNQKLMNCKFYGMLFRSLFSSSETCFEGELFIKWLVSLWFIARELPHLWPQPKVSNWKQIWFWVGEKSKVSQFRILGNLWKCCWLEQARASNVEKTSLLKAAIWWNDDRWELYDEVGGCDKNCSTEVTHYIYEP